MPEINEEGYLINMNRTTEHFHVFSAQFCGNLPFLDALSATKLTVATQNTHLDAHSLKDRADAQEGSLGASHVC